MNSLYKNYMMKMGGQWIQSAIKKPGALTKQAKAAGMSVSEFAQNVLSNKEDYSGKTVKRANLAKTLSRMKKGQGGMDFKNPMGADRALLASEMTEPMPTSSLMGEEFEVEPSIAAMDPNLDFARKDVASLEKQAERDNVRTYQRMLNQKYGAGLSEDGAWGPKTQAAYEKFITGKTKKDGYFVDEMKQKIAAQTPRTAQDEYEEMMAKKRSADAKKAKDDIFVNRMNRQIGSTPSRTSSAPSTTARPRTGTSISAVNEAARKRTSGLTNEDFKRFGRRTITPEMQQARQSLAQRAANRNPGILGAGRGLNTNTAFRDFANTLISGTPSPVNLKQVKGKDGKYSYVKTK
jgi:hypothetical protein